MREAAASHREVTLRWMLESYDLVCSRGLYRAPEDAKMKGILSVIEEGSGIEGRAK